jgi:hypothetical protein
MRTVAFSAVFGISKNSTFRVFCQTTSSISSDRWNPNASHQS